MKFFAVNILLFFSFFVNAQESTPQHLSGLWKLKRGKCSAGGSLARRSSLKEFAEFKGDEQNGDFEFTFANSTCNVTAVGKYTSVTGGIQIDVQGAKRSPIFFRPTAKPCPEIFAAGYHRVGLATRKDKVLTLTWEGKSLLCPQGESLQYVFTKVKEKPAKDPSRLKVLTFNAWTVEVPGIWQISKLIDERLAMLPSRIKNINPDIILFQEVWNSPRITRLIESLKKKGYPYSLYAIPGTLKRNGLLIISKYFLDPQYQLLVFSAHTRGDEGNVPFLYKTLNTPLGVVYKGAIKTRVKVPELGWVDLYDSHLGAVSTVTIDNKPDHFVAAEEQEKEKQAEELYDFIRQTRTSEAALLGVDLNTHYHPFENGAYREDLFTPEYSLMTCAGRMDSRCLGFVDSYRSLHGFENPPAWTFDTVGNNYAKDEIFASEPQEVLDYIFVTPQSQLVPLESTRVFGEKLESKGERDPDFLSDHYGVLTTFSVAH